MELEEEEEEDEEYESGEESEEDSDDEDEDDEDEYDRVNTTADAEDIVSKIQEHLLKMGHSSKDILTYFMGIRVRWDAGGFYGRMRKIDQDYNDLVDEWNRENEEREMFAMEDKPLDTVKINLEQEFDKAVVDDDTTVTWSIDRIGDTVSNYINEMFSDP